MLKNRFMKRTNEEKKLLQALGNNIRKAREARGISQEQFAMKAGFSRSYFTEIETGKRNISILNFMKILKGLDASPSDIIDFLKK